MSRQRDVMDASRRAIADDARQRLLAGAAVTERRLDLAGVSTAVLAGGDGPPVVLLHGQGGWSGMWLPLIPDLVRTHRVVAPDLPGLGASEVPDGPLDADRVLTWLGGLIQRTCPAPPALVGISLGASIAARFAIAHPDRLSRLVLLGAGGLGRFRPAPAVALAMARFIARPSERTHTGQRLEGVGLLGQGGVGLARHPAKHIEGDLAHERLAVGEVPVQGRVRAHISAIPATAWQVARPGKTRQGPRGLRCPLTGGGGLAYQLARASVSARRPRRPGAARDFRQRRVWAAMNDATLLATEVNPPPVALLSNCQPCRPSNGPESTSRRLSRVLTAWYIARVSSTGA